MIMAWYRTMVQRWGVATVEADSEEEALEKTQNMDESDFDWSEPDEPQVVEELDREER